MTNKKLIELYLKKNNTYLIKKLQQQFYSKRNSEKQNIFFSNLLACCFINLDQIENALNIYRISKKKIHNFDGPEIKYNIGILPENTKLTDKRISKYLRLKFQEFLSDKQLKDLTNSLKIDANCRGSYHSNLGQTLIDILKIQSLMLNKNRKINPKIFYLNYKYNSYRAEKLLKKNKFKEFKREAKKVYTYNPINMRLFAVISYAKQRYHLKGLNYFCSNTLEYVKEFDLIDNNDLKKNFLNNFNKFIKKLKHSESFAPGSVYKGFKSIGNLFEIKNKNVKILEKIFIKNINLYLNNFSKSKDKFIKDYPKKNKLKGWYIRIKNGGGIGYHIHNSWLSGGFYLRVPKKIENGKLEMSLANWGFQKKNKFLSTIIPKNGKLILFPSCLPHKVTKFEKNFFRVSVAFDIVAT